MNILLIYNIHHKITIREFKFICSYFPAHIHNMNVVFWTNNFVLGNKLLIHVLNFYLKGIVKEIFWNYFITTNKISMWKKGRAEQLYYVTWRGEMVRTSLNNRSPVWFYFHNENYSYWLSTPWQSLEQEFDEEGLQFWWIEILCPIACWD